MPTSKIIKQNYTFHFHCNWWEVALFGHETWPLANCQKFHIYSLSTPGGQNWAYFHSTVTLRFHSAVSEKRADFQNCHIRAWNLAIGQSSKSCIIYPLSTLKGRNWAYFRSMDSGFRDMGQFSKLPFLGMKLGHWPKFQKFYMIIPELPPSPKFHSVLLYHVVYGCPFRRCMHWQFCISW